MDGFAFFRQFFSPPQSLTSLYSVRSVLIRMSKVSKVPLYWKPLYFDHLMVDL